MIQLSDGQKAEYFHRSYTAVDGLWFMKLEERAGFGAALEVDVEVWKVMPKIQARKLKAMTGLEQGMGALFECFTTKLALEGFAFETSREAEGQGFEVRITTCPWYDLLIKSNRREIAGKIGNTICSTEYTVWASEFGNEITFSLGDQLCEGCKMCVVRFAASGR
jgi:hypothetical protein